MKVARTVLRGAGRSDASRLPDLELGGNVRKGSKGTTVVYANKLVVKDSETDDERAIPFLKRYTVFNGAP